MVGWFKLFQFSPTIYKVYLAIGIVSAMIAGTSMPLFIVFLSDLYDSFNPENDPKETFGKWKGNFGEGKEIRRLIEMEGLIEVSGVLTSNGTFEYSEEIRTFRLKSYISDNFWKER